jgi:hypothetical protein
MNKLFTLSTALLLTLGLSQASLAQGRGGGGGGGGHGKHAEQGPDNGPGADHPGKGGGKGRGHADNGGGQSQGGGEGRGERRAERAAGHVERIDRVDHPDRAIIRQTERRTERVDRVDRAIVRGHEVEDRTVIVGRPHGLIAGCPPGLAKKNNGCMPPGLARQMARAQVYDLWGRPSDGYTYRYNEGYLYRYDPRGGLLGYLPALGGALAVGNPWPVQYRYEPAPSYYSRYYGLNDPYDYRYADGALYGVDPRTNSIQQVVALLTGQPLQVGQRLPPGYDVYNVPYQYRAQYYDSPDRYYRYNDGYVYQVDPTTQLVQAIIQLLT